MSLSKIAEELRLEILKSGPVQVDIRKKRLLRLKEVIKSSEAEISEALKKDLGKSTFESYATETGFLLEDISFVIKNLDKWVKKKTVKTPLPLLPGKSFVYPEPYGVVLIVSPWNYPFQLSLSPLIGAIAAGNRVVLKPSELAPATAGILEKLLQDVFSLDEVRVVQGDLEETQVLLAQKWDYLFFTGSTAIGKVMMKAAAEHLTPVTLELGGKSPCIIDEFANLDLAAKRCAWGKFVNAGQTCVAPDYVLVPKQLKDTFVEKLKYYVHLFYGDDVKNSPDYPRIINERHFLRLKALVDPSRVAFGGDFNEAEKYISPTVLKDVEWSDKIMEDEIFGPVLPVISYDKLDDVLLRIAERPKPLALYLFSEKKSWAHQLMSKLSFGGGCINDTVIHLANPDLPFGGVGDSGLGSYHGKKSFDTFTHFKSVFEQSTIVDIPVRYPPYKGKMKWLKFFIN